MTTWPDAPEQLFGREAALSALGALGPGRRAVLTAAPGVGRTATLATFAAAWAARTGGEVLWGRPDAEPLVAVLTRWSERLGVAPPGPISAPTQFQAWARGALRGRELLVALDAVPAEDQARAHALIVDAPTYVYVSLSDEGWRADPIPLAALDEGAVGAWLRGACPGLSDAAVSRAARFASQVGVLSVLADAVRGLTPEDGDARIASLTDGVEGADALLQRVVHAWPPESRWILVAPRAGLTAEALAAAPDAEGPWRRAGLLRAAGDGRAALPPSVKAALAAVDPGNALRRRWVDHVLAHPGAAVEDQAVAIEHAGALGDGASLSTLVQGLLGPMMARGQGFDLLPLLGVWARVAKASEDLVAQATVKRHQGEIFAALGHAPRGLEFLADAARLADEAGAPALAGAAAFGQARIRQQLGFTDQAVEQFQGAVDRFTAAGEAPGQAAALDGLAMALAGVGRLEEASRAFQRMADLAASLGDRAGQVAGVRHAGLALLKAGRHEDALPLLSLARGGAHAIGDAPGEILTLRALGISYSALKRLPEAEEAWRDLIPLSRASGDVAGEILCSRELATLAGAQGDAQAQLRHLEQARALAHTQLDATVEAEIIGDIARLQIARGDLDGAIQTYQSQAQAAASGGMSEVAARALAQAAPLLQRLGREDEARQMLQTLRRRLLSDGGKALGIVDGALYRLAES